MSTIARTFCCFCIYENYISFIHTRLQHFIIIGCKSHILSACVLFVDSHVLRMEQIVVYINTELLVFVKKKNNFFYNFFFIVTFLFNLGPHFDFDI